MKKYYFVGIKGTGMSSLACMLNDMGNQVIGYDDYQDHKFTENPLIERNITIYYDNSYSLSNEVVVYTPACTKDHKELKRATSLGLEMLSYNEMLGMLTRQFKTICISGCHGKTTTTSLLAHIVDNIIGTNYLIGDSTGYIKDGNEYFMVESCEYRRHFLLYDPTYSIINNIELDHVDYYKDINDMVDAYQSLVNNTKKMAILNGDDSYARSIKTDKALYFGFNENNDIIAKNITTNDLYTSFDVYIKNEFYNSIEIPFFGNHIIMDTLAAIGICYLLELDKEKVKKEIKSFSGAKRRFTEIKVGDLIIIDDYAHHPTELEATINSARLKYPNKKVIAFFLPNTYSRVKAFYKEFAKVLNKADKAYILDIAKGRENPLDYPGVSSNLILDLLDNGEYIKLDEADKLIKYNDEVLLFMSCQNIYLLEDALIKLNQN